MDSCYFDSTLQMYICPGADQSQSSSDWLLQMITDPVVLMLWVVCVIACATLAHMKGRNVSKWGLVGFFLAAVGVLIALLVPSKKTT